LRLHGQEIQPFLTTKLEYRFDVGMIQLCERWRFFAERLPRAASSAKGHNTPPHSAGALVAQD
jgi:hypothetical protein